jgi:hypothetical protein
VKFNKESDKIALTIPEFKLLKSADGPFSRYSEPYIVSFAIDASGSSGPCIHFNYMPFPKVARGGVVTMLGDGHILYGPKNPGEYVAASVLIMECDQDIREMGKRIKRICESKATSLGLKSLYLTNPAHAAIGELLKSITTFVASELKQNKDDELFRTEGTFLKNGVVPYHINRMYTLGNGHVEMKLKVIPLKNSNGQGAEPEQIIL